MDDFQKSTEFLHELLCDQKLLDSPKQYTKINTGKLRFINQYWEKFNQDFCCMFGGSTISGLYAYFKSCEYSEHLIGKQKLKIEDLSSENKELKSLLIFLFSLFTPFFI